MPHSLFKDDIKPTQTQIGKLLGISERQVRELETKGILPKPEGKKPRDVVACINAYVRYKTASSNSGNQAENDDEEPAGFEERERRLELIDKRNNRRLDMHLKHAKVVMFAKTYAPIDLMVDALGMVGSSLKSRLENLIPKMKLAWEDMPPEAVEILEETIVAATRECADIQPDLSDYQTLDSEGDQAWIEYDPDERDSNRNGMG